MESQYRDLLFDEIDSTDILKDVDKKYKDGDNWNERYQYAVSLDDNTDEQRARKERLVSSVRHDFRLSAETYAKTIIGEYFLENKSVRLEPLGGVGGGKKYLCHGILFKLADGSIGPYDKNDEAAAKAIGHDLKGASEYFNCNIPGLYTALQTVIDFKGFRMSAQSFLPVSSETLKVGTADGCRTFKCEDQELVEKMAKAGAMLNLKPHKIKGRLVYSACDVEGHIGQDGRHYLLDLARAFPPECPIAASHLNPRQAGFIINQKVLHQLKSRPGRGCPAVVRKALPNNKYQILYLYFRKEPLEVDADELYPANMSIFWRLLRPEFVRYGGRRIMERQRKRHSTNIPPDPPPLGSQPTAVSDFEPVPEALPTLSIAKSRSEYISADGQSSIDNKSSHRGAVFLQDLSKARCRSFKMKPDYEPLIERKDEPENILDEFTPEAFESVAGSEAKAAPYSNYGYTSCKYGYDRFSSSKDSRMDIQRSKWLCPALLWTKPPSLSSDAFSTFSSDDPDFDVHNEEVQAATMYLLEEVVPAVACELREMDGALFNKSIESLSSFLHYYGVNIRHMGLLRSKVPDNGEERNMKLRSALLIEIVSRTLKNLLKGSLRFHMKRGGFSEQGIFALVSRIFNFITGTSDRSASFWEGLVLPGIYHRFGKVALTASEQEALQDTCQHDGQFLLNLVERVCEVAGVKFSLTTVHGMKQCIPNGDWKGFDPDDIQELLPIVKEISYQNFKECIIDDCNRRVRTESWIVGGENFCEDHGKQYIHKPSDNEFPPPIQPSQEGQSPSLVQENWCCSMCTFINISPRTECEMCGTPNTTESTAKGPELERDESSFKFKTFKDVLELDKWTCSACTFINSPARKDCEICGTSVGEAFQNPASVPASAEATNVINTNQANEIHPADSSSPNDEASKNVSSKEHWSCSVCTFLNNPARTICEVCGESNTKVSSVQAPVQQPEVETNSDSKCDQEEGCFFSNLLGNTLVRNDVSNASTYTIKLVNKFPLGITLEQKENTVILSGFDEAELAEDIKGSLQKGDILLKLDDKDIQGCDLFHRVCGGMEQNAIMHLEFLKKNVEQFTVETSTALENKVVGLYFSAGWCQPSKEFQDKLKLFYERIKQSARGFEIVYIHNDKDEAGFKEQLSEMPWIAVPFSESEKTNTIASKYDVTTIPSLLIFGEDGSLITAAGKSMVQEDPNGIDFPWHPKPIFDLLGEELQGKQGTVTVDELRGKYLGIYIGGSWCPACRNFLPNLAEAYTNLKLIQGVDFEIIYVSRDQSEEEFLAYYEMMPWFMIPYGDARITAISTQLQNKYIPRFVMINPEGQIINHHAEEQITGDPEDHERFPWETVWVYELNSFNATSVGNKVYEKPSLLVFMEYAPEAEQVLLVSMLQKVAKGLDEEQQRIGGNESVIFFAVKSDELQMRALFGLPLRSASILMILLDMSDAGSFYIAKRQDPISEERVKDFLQNYKKGERRQI